MMTKTTEIVDELFYYDDQSDDDSTEVSLGFTRVHTAIRPENVPSFLQHEGKFRQAAWDLFEATLLPEEGDWILAIDTDEVLVSSGNVRENVKKAIEAAETCGADSVILPIPEVFDVVDGVPMVRIDGLWGNIRGFRLFRYRSNGVYADKAMGCGAEPSYVAAHKKSTHNCGLYLMHFGYADQRDRVTKFRRYTDLIEHGHNDNHVRSILTNPQLQAWTHFPVSLERAS